MSLFRPTTMKHTMTGDDLIFQAMDLPGSGLYFNDVDVPSSAIAINNCGTHNWDVSDIFPDFTKQEKLLSTSPNTFVTSEYTSHAQSAINALHCTTAGGVPMAMCAAKVPDSVQLRNHDCMWSGRCNQQESHQKMKLKAAAAAAAAAALAAGGVQQPQQQQQQQSAKGQQCTTSRQMTPAQSPTKVRTIQAGESLLRFKQPGQTKAAMSPTGSSSSGDENNNRPDTPQSLGGGEDQSDSMLTTSCTTTGSNHLPLLTAKEHEVNKIKEYLADPAKQYKAYDHSTTLADVINTLESGEFKRDSAFPMSPADESDSSSSSRHVVDDDTESEHEMDEDEDEEYGLQEDDEGISLKMMPTSHLSSSRAYEMNRVMLQQQQQQQQQHYIHRRVKDEDEEEDEDEEATSEEDEEEEEEEDVKPDVSALMGSGVLLYPEDEEDSGTERSLYGTTLTEQEKMLIMQQSSMHSDHCYTRVKSRVDIKNLGVDTPSDSEEEIDVVGVGEKNLPTNPSAKDRKALQATVRNRFVRSSAGGIITAPPTGPNSGATTPGGGRSTVYYNNHMTISSSSSSSSTKKVSHKQQQRQYNKQLDDLYADELAMEGHNISSSGRKLGSAQMRNSGNSGKGGSASSRKRPAASSVGSMGYSKSSKHYHDSKKSKYSGSANGSGMKSGSRPIQKGYGSTDYRNASMTSFTMEKRNLHNDLERQRRVGLKNLFEELKCQLPSLRDKERAPKVSILREAAMLCTEMSREQETLFALRKQRDRLLQTARMLKTQLQRSAERAK